MADLTKSEILELDSQIDAGISGFDILKLPRAIVLLHLLRFYEDYLRLFLPGMIDVNDVQSYLAGRKNAQDAMNFTLVWAAQRAPISAGVDLMLDEKAYQLSFPMFQAAMQYSHIWDLMALLLQGRARGITKQQNHIEVSYTDALASDFDVAGRIIAPPDAPGHGDAVVDEAPKFEGLLSELNPRDVGGGKVKYDLSPCLFDRMKAIQRPLLNHLWELDSDWKLGGYTVADFREVWLSLVTFSLANQLACLRSGAIGGGLSSLVPVKSLQRWRKELIRWSGVPKDALEQIIADLTFAPELRVAGKKQPDVTFQPFIALSNHLLALSGSLVLDSNAERNLWALLSIIRPHLHSSLRNKKERQWLQELMPWLAAMGLQCVSGFPVKLCAEESDLDLLVLDRKQKFGLGFQLKWLTAPDRIRDVAYTDRELTVGVEQADLSLRWLNTRPAEVARKLGMERDEFGGLHFEAAVLSKNALGSSAVFRKNENIPVITERLMRWVLGEPHHKSLEALWSSANKRSYFPVRGMHYEDADIEADFNDVHFRGLALGMTLLKPWSPQTDIHIA